MLPEACVKSVPRVVVHKTMRKKVVKRVRQRLHRFNVTVVPRVYFKPLMAIARRVPRGTGPVRVRSGARRVSWENTNPRPVLAPVVPAHRVRFNH